MLLADDEFLDLCFDFGIELDDVTNEKEMVKNEQGKAKEGLSEETLYKIEIPANRYDLLCLEGLAMSLKTFLGITPFPEFKIVNKAKEQFFVDPSVKQVRPFVCSAILRNVSFTNERLIAFMELQEKLHHNICRGRTLVSMGTHDYDTVKGPFTFKAVKPEDFKFRPLSRGGDAEINGNELLTMLVNDPKLKHYVPLLQDEPLFPILVDSNGLVMAVPPIINSEHSKITLKTKNVFIDVTAKDLTKAGIVLNTLVSMFSCYCEEPFTIEEVEVVTPTGKKIMYPDISIRHFSTEKTYLNRLAGIQLEAAEIATLLNRMALKATSEGDIIKVEVPITRSDIIHPCDIAEDLAIAYGFNKIEKVKTTTVCNGYQQPNNKLTDLFRNEMAFAGFTESLTMSLLSKKDQFTNMLQDINDLNLNDVVQIYKSKTSEFEVFRTSLIPGILKTIYANQTNPVSFDV
jgi:phenylalanyl-tRNA synthetase beta chain